MTYLELQEMVFSSIEDVFPFKHELEEYSTTQKSLRYNEICNNIIAPENIEKWKKFVDKVNGISSTTPAPPRHAGRIKVRQIETTEIQLNQEVIIEMSGICPCYTIYGLDSFSHRNEDYRSLAHCLVISPLGPFKDIFLRVQAEMDVHYPDYALIPFKLLNTELPEYSLLGIQNDLSPSIYQFLFHPDIPPYKMVIGDKRFGIPSSD